ncbi:hypothetical protein PUN4_760035 [Paraburkholderia unamae]|nr:hypothetical protein PUN4_760035 [Paraburkholderia unamae]
MGLTARRSGAVTTPRPVLHQPPERRQGRVTYVESRRQYRRRAGAQTVTSTKELYATGQDRTR